MRMKNLPLTETQIEICNTVLTNNNNRFNEFIDKKYSRKDNVIALSYLKDFGLLINIDTIILSDLGSRYSEKGIQKFIRDKRNEEFFNSPVFKTYFIIIPILVSIIFNVVNCRQNDKNKADNNNYLKKNDVEVLINNKLDSVNKVRIEKTIYNPTKDTTKHIDTKLNVNSRKE